MSQRPSEQRQQRVKQQFAETATAVTALYREAKTAYENGYIDGLKLLRRYIVLTQNCQHTSQPGEASSSSSSSSGQRVVSGSSSTGIDVRMILAFIDKKICERQVCLTLTGGRSVPKEDTPPPPEERMQPIIHSPCTPEPRQQVVEEQVIFLSPVPLESDQIDEVSLDVRRRHATALPQYSDVTEDGPGEIPSSVLRGQEEDVAEGTRGRRPAVGRAGGVPSAHSRSRPKARGEPPLRELRRKRENELSAHVEADEGAPLPKRKRQTTPPSAMWVHWTEAVSQMMVGQRAARQLGFDDSLTDSIDRFADLS